MLLVLRILLAHSEGDIMKLKQKIFCFLSFEWHFFSTVTTKTLWYQVR